MFNFLLVVVLVFVGAVVASLVAASKDKFNVSTWLLIFAVFVVFFSAGILPWLSLCLQSLRQ
jgi:hypothetical protein